MNTPQEKMKARLEALGIPYKEIRVYGGQIVVTCVSVNTATKWASLLGNFAKVRGTVQSIDYTKENKGTCLVPTTTKVWRVFATVR